MSQQHYLQQQQQQLGLLQLHQQSRCDDEPSPDSSLGDIDEWIDEPIPRVHERQYQESTDDDAPSPDCSSQDINDSGVDMCEDDEQNPLDLSVGSRQTPEKSTDSPMISPCGQWPPPNMPNNRQYWPRCR